MANKTYISIKDFNGDEKKISTFLDIENSEHIQRFSLGTGVVDSLSDAVAVAIKQSSINIVCPSSFGSFTPSDCNNKFVIVPKFYDPIHVANEVIGTGDGVEDTFNFTLADTPIIPNSITIDYTSGSSYSGYDEYSGDPDSESGLFAGDLDGDINYRTGSGSITCMFVPDNGTSVYATYDYFSTIPANTNIQITPYLYYNDNSSDNIHVFLDKGTQTTLNVSAYPSVFQNVNDMFRAFADVRPGGSYTNDEDWFWAGDTLSVENTKGANTLLLTIDQFTHSGTGSTYSIYVYGI